MPRIDTERDTSQRLPSGQRWMDAPLVYDIGAVPPVDLADYRLRIHGAAASSLDLSWEDILALPRATIVRDFHCVTFWSVRDVAWEGLRVRDLLDRVVPDPEARWVLVRGRDGYSTSVPIEDFSRPDNLFAYRMNGAPILPEHGHPLRLVIPSLYAWKSAKYVDEVEFIAHLHRGFWEERGYHDRGDPWREERYRT